MPGTPLSARDACRRPSLAGSEPSVSCRLVSRQMVRAPAWGSDTSLQFTLLSFARQAKRRRKTQESNGILSLHDFNTRLRIPADTVSMVGLYPGMTLVV